MSRKKIAVALFVFLIGFVTARPSHAVNRPPTTTAVVVVTNEDTIALITINGTDPEGASVTFTTPTTSNRGGSVSCLGTLCTYTPPSNVNGSDYFSYSVSDGTISANGRVTITITAVNDAPTLSDQNSSTNEDVAKSVILTATDIDRNALSYSIATQPSHGTATLSGSLTIYTPTANYNGSDSFTVKAYDGTAYSTPATVTMTVNAVNDVPTVTNQETNITEDTTTTFGLSTSDVDGNALTVTLYRNTTKGTLNVSGTTATYTPNADYNGDDSFSYQVNDGTTNSPTRADVTLHVTAVNDAPVADAKWIRAANGKPAHLVVSATDVDSSTFTYSIAARPAHGTAFIWNENRVFYLPRNDYDGSDSFSYTASDGTSTSTAATVTVDVNADIESFPIDTLAVDSAVTKSTTADTIILTLPTATDGCQKTVGTQPVIPTTAATATGIVATHYSTLLCGGRENYEEENTAIYFIAPNGTSDGLPNYEAYLLDVGYNVEAPGVYLENGTLIFPLTNYGGFVKYSLSNESETTTIEESLITPFQSGGVVDSTPLYDHNNGLIYTGSTNVPETCYNGDSNDCGQMALVSLYDGETLDKLDEDDDFNAWFSGACLKIDHNGLSSSEDKILCGFAEGGETSDSTSGMHSCEVALLHDVGTPSRTNNTLTTELSFDATYDLGNEGCTEVGALKSGWTNGSFATDGNYFYGIPYGSSTADSITQLATWDLDLNADALFEISSDYSHTITNGFYNQLLLAQDGNLYMTVTMEDDGNTGAAVLRIDPTTGLIDTLYFSSRFQDGQLGTAHLFLDSSGNEVIAFAKGDTGVVLNLTDGSEVASYTLGSESSHSIAPVLISDNDGNDDALMFVSIDNVVTIIPNTGLMPDTEAPCAGPRCDEFRQGTFEAD